jgi:hypothetical protein
MSVTNALVEEAREYLDPKSVILWSLTNGHDLIRRLAEALADAEKRAFEDRGCFLAVQEQNAVLSARLAELETHGPLKREGEP